MKTLKKKINYENGTNKESIFWSQAASGISIFTEKVFLNI